METTETVAGIRRSCVNYGLRQASSLGSTASYMLFTGWGGKGKVSRELSQTENVGTQIQLPED